MSAHRREFLKQSLVCALAGSWTGFDAAYPSLTFVGDEALITYYLRSTDWKRDSEVTLKIFQTDQFYA